MRRHRGGRGRGGVDEHHAGDLVGILRGVAHHVQAAEGMPGQHVGAGDVRSVEQRVQGGRDLRAVGRRPGGVTPSASGSVVDADPGVAGHVGRDPTEGRCGSPAAGLEDHGRSTCSRCTPGEADMAPHRPIDRAWRRWVSIDRPMVSISPGEREQHEDGQHRVEQPSAGPAVAGPAWRGRRPRPPERAVRAARPSRACPPVHRVGRARARRQAPWTAAGAYAHPCG